jgi:hypothetical protein
MLLYCILPFYKAPWLEIFSEAVARSCCSTSIRDSLAVDVVVVEKALRASLMFSLFWLIVNITESGCSFCLAHS